MASRSARRIQSRSLISTAPLSSRDGCLCEKCIARYSADIPRTANGIPDPYAAARPTHRIARDQHLIPSPYATLYAPPSVTIITDSNGTPDGYGHCPGQAEDRMTALSAKPLDAAARLATALRDLALKRRG